MRAKSILPRILILFLAAMLVGTVSSRAGSDMKLEVQLVWGTNDSQSPDPRHKSVDADVQKKLKELPLKWTHYFQVSSHSFDLAVDATKKEPLSEKCSIEVKNLGHSTVEVSLYGKGEQVVKRTQALPKGEILIMGGNAPNSTAWLVVLKRLE